jgi:ActR/RegA family two-component response regulator
VDVLLLCDDLIFTSRVAGTASAAGLTMRAMKSERELLDAAHRLAPRCVIVDLNITREITATVNALKALPRVPQIVGYGSHVDVETLKKARDAGCAVVWPRSKFVEELPTALPEWCAAP